MFVLLAVVIVPGCQPNEPARADLQPTLENRQVNGGRVAFQNGIPVPSFGLQPRPRIDLTGPWRFEPAALDETLSLTDRSRSEAAIEREADGRQKPGYDDRSWRQTDVPGTFNEPPDQRGGGGWYRRSFDVPSTWAGLTGTLQFAAARYVTDVWLNGTHLGYHEGGSTPFAFDASSLRPGQTNTLAVRVDNPVWGTRNDIVPWGLADWWNYGGLVGPVWLEASDPLHVSRADVVPHLDGADTSIVVTNSGKRPRSPTVTVELLPASITPQNLLNPDPASLVPPGAAPIVQRTDGLGRLAGGETTRLASSFLLRGVDLWTPSQPALYVLHAVVREGSTVVDQSYETFGLRQIKVDTSGPRLLLNGALAAFRGVSVHDERQSPPAAGNPRGGPMTQPEEFLAQLRQAQGVHADLVRADHHPPDAWLPLLADRLGIGIWEEIPLYHYTPQSFDIVMSRGIAQQTLEEMDLRDFDRPSVLFHGFANESTGGAERQSALTTLRNLDREIDGTRLTGQAAYGSDPTDTTSTPLDVAGFTWYWGVFYGGRLSAELVERQLAKAHRTYPSKPIMILEFGHWADSPAEEAYQAWVFDTTYAGIGPWLDDLPGGYVGAAVYWSMDDYWTERPGIQVEHFGLYRPDGTLRPVGERAAYDYAQAALRQPRVPAVTGGAGELAPRADPYRQALLYGGVALLAPSLLLVTLIGALVLLGRRRRRRWRPSSP
ncbi:MAG: beta galactosidase jelly roll domain-containing protein [Candidatus Dormibacteraeota bacterium]|nr:beta galactosidase jelly roll domain-containing protein [Candidatus Dormibacteraeota bacterium]MBO0761576.1 beta galactosidase jelly roll domain-containing protein [Candidatus Dormibacteraeota bacterium]